MQYTELAWSVRQHKNALLFAIRQGVMSVSLLIITSGGVYTLTNGHYEIKPYILVLIMLVSMIPSLIMLNCIMYWTWRKYGFVFHSFRISEPGISINGQLYPFKNFNPNEVAKSLKAKTLPYEQWEEKTEDKQLLLEIPYQKESLKLEFNRELDRQKFIRSLAEYLNINIALPKQNVRFDT